MKRAKANNRGEVMKPAAYRLPWRELIVIAVVVLNRGVIGW